VRSKLAVRITEAIKNNTEFLQVGCKLGRWRATLMLIHLGPCLDSVRPMKREPQRRPFINGPFKERSGLTYLFFPQCCPKGIAEMTNHLMGGHASPTALILGAHLCQSVEHFVAVGCVEESFHVGKAILHISRRTRRRSLYHGLGRSPDKSRNRKLGFARGPERFGPKYLSTAPRRCDRNTSELPQCGQGRWESGFISNDPYYTNLGYTHG